MGHHGNGSRGEVLCADSRRSPPARAREGDDAGQIELIENAIAQGQAGILITPMSVNVNDAISKAREAGLYVIALDTPTDPPDVVDITFATDNCLAGEAIGQWAAGKLNGEKAIIAELVIFNDRVVSVDYCRANGFLKGMGIEVPTDRPSTGPISSRLPRARIAAALSWALLMAFLPVLRSMA